MRYFSVGERGPGDWDVSDNSGRIFAVRTKQETGKVYLRDERPGHTREQPKEFDRLAEVMTHVTDLLMTPTSEN
jgi:hypothetical protein